MEIGTFIKGVDALFFEDYSDTDSLEFLNQPNTIFDVPSESGYGFGDDHINLTPLTSGNQAVKLHSLFPVGAGDAHIGENACHLPIRVLADFLSVIGFLHISSVDLVITVDRSPAIGSYPNPTLQCSLFHERSLL